MTGEVMIGIETHVQLNTKSKMFCSDPSDQKDAEPNSNTCPICLGMPGSKPNVNKVAVEYGILVGLALNCSINKRVFFSRKAYFYPDLSKNFQITQYEVPIAINGKVQLGSNTIRIRRVHIEEDPAKLIYSGGDITNSKGVLIDYNRAGVPLAEIVTEPDFKSPKEVRNFLERLSSILEYLGVYDSTREMSLRVDANISIDGGERVEVKNITGFENVEKALSYEIIRQNGLSRMNILVQRETRHFDAEMRTTKSLRKKEYEDDYGYIFDPDLPMINLGDDYVLNIKSSMPELPEQMARRFEADYKINEYYANVIVYSGKDMASFFEDTIKLHNDPQIVANWLINYALKSLNWRSERISSSKMRPDSFAEFLEMIKSGEITERYAKELIKEYVDTGASPRSLINKDMKRVDKNELIKIVAGIIDNNSEAVAQFRSGRLEAMQFLIGQVLNKTKKQADPKEIKGIIESLLK